MISPTSPSASRRALTSKLLLPLAALGLGSAPSLYAVNAAWNTDASSGNFNTAQWTSGVTVPAAGGTYTVASGDALYFGTSTTTTLNNDLTSATFAGLTFNSGASAFTIGGNSFTLTGNIVNNSTSTQTINNDIVISGARQFNATSGQLVFGGNISGNTGGSWTLNATNKITLSGTNNLTLNANFGGLLINPTGGDASAGGVDITGSTTINGAAGNTQSGYMNIAGTVTLAIKSGGSLTINPTTGTAPGGIIGQNKAGTSTISVENGGSLTLGGNQGLAFGNNISTAIGVLDVSGTATIAAGSTTATDTRSFVALGRDSGTGTVNLNTGGVLATGRNFIRDGSGGADTVGAGNFNFKGGTLKALANQSDWLNSATINTNQLALTSVTTTDAASTIDSNGFTVAINNAISGTGGFNIISSSGNGTVTFGGANTYTGLTTISSGTLALTGSLASSAITVGSGATFTNNGTVTGSLDVSGILMGAGSFGATTIKSGGALNPGNSPGTQSHSSLTLEADSTTTMEIESLSSMDLVTVSGTLVYGGSLVIEGYNNYDLGAVGAVGTYSLFDLNSSDWSGTFSSVALTGIGGLTSNGSGFSGTYGGLDYTFVYSTGDLTIAASAIPEPSTYAGLAGLVALGVVAYRRRRRA